ncbi:MAG: hypothetical protein ACYTBV_19875, partial [Planctomycetota bacterium]
TDTLHEHEHERYGHETHGHGPRITDTFHEHGHGHEIRTRELRCCSPAVLQSKPFGVAAI